MYIHDNSTPTDLVSRKCSTSNIDRQLSFGLRSVYLDKYFAEQRGMGSDKSYEGFGGDELQQIYERCHDETVQKEQDQVN